jgi:hypothetical protein
MFQLYEERIRLDDQIFLEFVSRKVRKYSADDPETLPYPELYGYVRNAIREFLHLGGDRPRNEK